MLASAEGERTREGEHSDELGRPAAATSAASTASSVLSAPSSGFEATDTRQRVQSTHQLAAQPASTPSSVEHRRQYGCQSWTSVRMRDQ